MSDTNRHHPDPADAFRTAVGIVGSQAATGEIVGLTQPAISKILAAGKVCPSENGAVIKLEKATGISRHDLRPDLYPRESPARTDSMETAR